MISVATVGGIWLGRSPSLPPMWKKASLRVLAERETICCPCILGVAENLQIDFFSRQTIQADVLFDVSFSISYFCSYILIHHTELPYYSSGGVDYWSRIRVITGHDFVVIILQYQMFLLQYFYMLLINSLKWCDRLFTNSIVRCISEGNITIWLFNLYLLEDKHSIICPGFLYLDSSNGVVCYRVDVFSLGSIKYFDGCNTYLGVVGKLGRTKGG